MASMEGCSVGEMTTRLEFTVSNYSQIGQQQPADCHAFYVSPRGAKVEVKTGRRWMLSFTIELYTQWYQLPGEFDNEIQWPVNAL